MNILLCAGGVIAVAALLAVSFAAGRYRERKIQRKITADTLADTVHDLRSPLTAIKGFADALREDKIPPDNRDHALSVISEEADRLSRLTGALLDVSRLASGKKIPQKTVFDVQETVRRAALSLELRMEEKKLTFVQDAKDEKTPVLSDEDAVMQVLCNLLDNAVKFADEGTAVTVSVSGKNASHVEISVHNFGKGLTESQKKQVFDRFFQTDLSSSAGLTPKKAGVGLGLFIVKTKLDALGEHIAVSGTPGTDCRFTFTLTKPTP